ncbi:ribosomal protein S7 domain-containing protein [Butyriboletus roseoflavus]|nr:ribosomal protein S7 domain-containing protein [Butyriboletus roseoflavus]
MFLHTNLHCHRDFTQYSGTTMNASRITASASALARLPPRLMHTHQTAFTVPCIWIRRVSTKTSNDEHTLAKSADMLNALMGSTMGLNTAKSTSAPSPLQAPSRPTCSFHPAHDPLLDYIAAVIQRHGLRARAARTVSRMLLHIHTFTRAPPTPIVREAIMTAAPAVRVVSFKYGTKVMMTPQPLTEKQRVRAGLKAIIAASESRPGKSLEVRLAREMISVVQKESRSLDEKERLHRLAMVNRGNLRR